KSRPPRRAQGLCARSGGPAGEGRARGRGARVRRGERGRPPRPRALPLPAADGALPRRALAAAARASHLRAGSRRPWRRRVLLAARERAARRAGRAGAPVDARAALRVRDQLLLPRGALRALLRVGRAVALLRL